jgi:hypothetical protein
MPLDSRLHGNDKMEGITLIEGWVRQGANAV